MQTFHSMSEFSLACFHSLAVKWMRNEWCLAQKKLGGRRIFGIFLNFFSFLLSSDNACDFAVRRKDEQATAKQRRGKNLWIQLWFLTQQQRLSSHFCAYSDLVSPSSSSWASQCRVCQVVPSNEKAAKSLIRTILFHLSSFPPKLLPTLHYYQKHRPN